jgi:EpsI family protein
MSCVIGTALIAGGWLWAREVIFPLGFLILALPIPGVIERPLQLRWQPASLAVADGTLRILGIQAPIQNDALPAPAGGPLMPANLSTLRSIPIVLAVAVFVGYLRGFSVLRGASLIALAVPVVAAINLVRLILVGWLQASFGPRMSHDATQRSINFITVLFGISLILLLSRLLRPTPRESRRMPSAASATTPLGAQRLWLATAILIGGFGFSVHVYFQGQFRVLQLNQRAPLEQLPADMGVWKGRDLEISKQVQSTLTFDRAIHRVYRDDFGHEIFVWVIYWEGSTSIRGYHHPDVCLANLGWMATEKDRRPIFLEDGTALSVTIRHIERSPFRQQVYYWTQEGSRVLSDEDEANADKAGPANSWIAARLVGNPPAGSARLTVIIYADLSGHGDKGHRILDNFTKRFARQLFAICPWAEPAR